MAYATILLDVTRSGRSQAGVVWTGVCLRLGDLSFPSARWTDLAVVVLGWWVQALLSLLRGVTDRKAMMFMEGPFSVEIQATSQNNWRVTCVERGSRRVIRAQADVDSRSLVTSVIDAGEEALELCRFKGWWSADAEALEFGLSELRDEWRRGER